MIHSINLGRLIAAVAIVFLHASLGTILDDCSRLGRFAVPFFTIASCYFTIHTSFQPQSFTQFLSKRVKRIYLIFLIWNCIYLICRLSASFILSNGKINLNSDMFVYNFFLNGFAHHLWFLPFILVCSTSVYLLCKFTIKKGRLSWLHRVIFCLLFLSIYSFDILPQLSSNLVVTLANHTLPAVGFSFLIKADEIFSKNSNFLLFLFLLLLLSLYFKPSYLTYNITGAILFIYCLNIKSSFLLSHKDHISPLAFGIYLNHILFVEGFQDICFQILKINSTYLSNGIIIILSLAFSVLFYFLAFKLKLNFLNGSLK